MLSDSEWFPNGSDSENENDAKESAHSFSMFATLYTSRRKKVKPLPYFERSFNDFVCGMTGNIPYCDGMPENVEYNRIILHCMLPSMNIDSTLVITIKLHFS